MNLSASRVPSPFRRTLDEFYTVLRSCWIVFTTNKLIAFAILIAALVLAALVWPHDRAWLNALHAQGLADALPHNVAWYLSTFGDYPTYNLPFALLLWIYGATAGKPRWCRLAVVALLGATLAGFFDDSLRLTLGRARPDANLPDGFYGPVHALHGGFQSFPSGHAASTFGMSMALLLVEWPLGVLTACAAFAVAWARLELNRHYPSDVLVGSMIGIYFGLLVGFAARREASVAGGSG